MKGFPASLDKNRSSSDPDGVSRRNKDKFRLASVRAVGCVPYVSLSRPNFLFSHLFLTHLFPSSPPAPSVPPSDPPVWLRVETLPALIKLWAD